MIYLNVVLTVNEPGDTETVATLLGQQAAMSLKEPGCARFEAYRSALEPDVFFLVEQWLTQAHLDGHRQGQAFTEIYQPRVLPLVTRQAHPCYPVPTPE